MRRRSVSQQLLVSTAQLALWACLLAYAVAGTEARQRGGEHEPPPASSATPESLAADNPARASTFPFAAVDPPADFHVPPGRQGEILGTASEFERGLLEDGVLAFAEYERAMLAGFECLQREGVTVLHETPRVDGGSVAPSDVRDLKPGPRLSGRGQYLYVLRSASSDLSSLQRAESNCATQYFATVSLLWAENLAPAETEKQAMRAIVGQCMRDRDLDVPADPSEQDLLIAGFPPDGTIIQERHFDSTGAPVASVRALFDCRRLAEYEMGFL